MDLETARQALARPAVRFEIGGFRPSDDPIDSWFGHVNVAETGEQWPLDHGQPMQPLCQINLTHVQALPSALRRIELIAIFVSVDSLPQENHNGAGWVLRTYRDLSKLVPINPLPHSGKIKPLPMRPSVTEQDFPCRDDVDIELTEELQESFHERFENLEGLKVGGWPTLIQSEIFWGPYNQNAAEPSFLFQIDSVPKCNWSWGHDGIGYFGRGTADGHTDEWFCEWQCL